MANEASALRALGAGGGRAISPAKIVGYGGRPAMQLAAVAPPPWNYSKEGQLLQQQAAAAKQKALIAAARQQALAFQGGRWF